MTTEQTKTEQWTPAPWVLVGGGGDGLTAVCDATDGSNIARLHPAWLATTHNRDEVWANAVLLKIAPRLYTALKNLVAHYDEAEINEAIAVLAAARGEPMNTESSGI